MTSTFARLSRLSPEQRARVLAKAREAAGLGSEVDDTIRPVPRDGMPPASFVQEQFWFMHQLDPGRPTYNSPFSFHLNGKLDVGALARTLTEIGDRHEVLRTRLVNENGRLLQDIAPAYEVELEVVDLSEQRDEEVRRTALDVVRTVFDIDRGPLVRTVLIRASETEHLLVWVADHSVSDGLSFGVLAKELAAIYEPTRLNQQHALEPLPVQFADIAHWQRDQLSEHRTRLVEHWRSQLKEAQDLDLPLDRPRPPAQTYDGDTRWFTVPADLANGLRELSRDTGLTLFMTLLSAFEVLLGAHSGQTDFVVGVPVSGRRRPETAGLIGAFLNTIPLRADLNGDPTCRELLSRVSEKTLTGFANQDLPFGVLVEELVDRRDPSRNPVYQAMFGFGNTPVGDEDIPVGDGLTVRPKGIANGTARVELEIVVEEVGDELLGRLEFNTDLFAPDTADRMVARYLTILREFAGKPDHRLSELTLVDDGERALIERWNDTAVAYPIETTIDRLVRDQAVRTPGRVAVGCTRTTLTYRELEDAANRVANTLRANGVSRGDLVGVCLDRSSDMVVALLGVLRSGAAYVPLDPSYPKARLEHMLANAGISVLVASTELPFEVTDQKIIDPAGDEVANASPAEPRPLARPDDPAYVIYTSGSTGLPKGVVVEHRAVANLLYAMRDLIGVDEADVQVSLASLSFDMAVPELFLPLTVGAAVVVGEKEHAANGARLLELLRDYGATILQATPTTWQLLLDAGLPENLLQQALCTAEAMPATIARRLREKVGRVWNLYGPTEATVFVSAHRIAEHDEQTPPIGRPLANTVFHMLDQHGRPAPIGTPGELYIGGAGLARGYLGLPEHNAERFLELDGTRVYRTGDLVRQRPDGVVEYLGRMDHQVKLRGFRIELGEVETAVASHPSVSRAVVLLVPFGPDDQRLVAYVHGGTDDLRAHVSAKLPAYMVPSHFVRLDEFPLTPNGKLDRQALRQIQVDAGASAVHTPPANDTERAVAEIWSDVLGVPDIGRDDDFFAVGGHSLLAIQVIGGLNERFDVALTVDVVFREPTVAGLATVLDEQSTGSPLLRALDQLDQMSDAEVAALLERLGN